MSTPKPADQKVLTLLHVDDDEDDRFLVARSVNHLPINLTAASSGPEALRSLSEKSPLPDLIMLDVRMPGMSGFEVLQHLKLADGLSSIPVVMFSNSSYSDDIHKARELGAFAYCVKPAGISEYRELLADLYNGWLRSEPPCPWPAGTPGTDSSSRSS